MIPNLFSKQRNGCMGQTGKDSISLILILLIMSVLLLRGIYDPTVSGFADAERHLMGGAFILDFLCEMPISNIYDFTTHYYARYPAISIGYHPPFFPCIEAMFNAVFGINIWSSRLAILLFALIGVSAWFKLIQRIFDTHTAFWASLLLITTPYLVQWEWYTMAEIPALSMAMLTACIFYRFLENGKPAYLYTTAITFSLTVWTKQTAVFIVLWFILYLIVRRQFTSFIKRTIAYTKHSRLSWENLKLYFFVLVNNHLTWPFMILCGTGFGWAIWKRDNRCMYFILLIMSVYLFFTFLNAKTDRYPIFWIPAFCLFAALPIVYSQKYKICYLVHVIVLVAIVIYQISYIYKKPLFYIRGYDEAVHYILRKNQTSTIFFDGRHKNYFIYLMRVLDEKKSMYVLRGNKLLTSSSITPGHWLKIHAYSHDDIKRIFDTYGISYIVVEKEDWTGIEIHKELRSYLNSGPFRLIKEIPIETNRWQPQTLRIYQYLHAKSITEDCLELRLPSVGKTLNVSIQRD